jgi:hypothetical protein
MVSTWLTIYLRYITRRGGDKLSENGWVVLLLMAVYILILSVIESYRHINEHIATWHEYYQRRDGENLK